MPVRQLIIIGGGLSGLSVLEAVMSSGRLSPQEVLLLEREVRPGGTIFSERDGDCLAEWGPNGFLDSRAATLELIERLGLSSELVRADRQASRRFIMAEGRLHAMPVSPVDMMRFPLLSAAQKIRLLAEPFIPRGNDSGETVYAFGCRRLGEGFARYFLDPMVSGVFAGDAQALELSSAFPRIRQIEQQHGSLVRGMLQLMRERKLRSAAGQPAGELTTLKGGMGCLVEALAGKFAGSLRLSEPVEEMRFSGGVWQVVTPAGEYHARHVVLSIPAYAAARLLGKADPALAALLGEVPYAAAAVVALSFPADAFITRPQGFGFLVPSFEQRMVLGVLEDSNLFPGRCPAGEILLRAIVGGVRYPQALESPDHELVVLALKEISAAWGLRPDVRPRWQRVVRWPRAIPQYNVGHALRQQKINSLLGAHPGLYLAANYVGGISMNDCIASGRLAAQRLGYFHPVV